MKRHIASALSMGTTTIAAVFAVAAIASGNAYADDITIDTTPFVSSRTRAEVHAEAMGQAAQGRTDEWSLNHNDPSLPTSGYTREQAVADYKGSRQYVNALYGEDSGSAYLMKFAARARASMSTTAMAHGEY